MTTRTMTAALALALGLCTGFACGDDEPACDVDLDTGDLTEKLCAAVDTLVDCVAEKYGEVDADDPDLELKVDDCRSDFEFCSIDPSSTVLPEHWTVREIRGEQNECIG